MDIKDLRGLMEAYSEVYAPQEVDEATAMAKRGYDETKLRKRAGGGAAADRATELEKKPTFGDAKKAKQRSEYARKQRGDFRNTASSSPGLHGYGHQSNDPKVKAKQAARGAQRGALTPNEKKQLNMEMEYDVFDTILEFLYVEGYAETLEEAEWMMANLIDEEAIDIILGEALTGDRAKKAIKKPGGMAYTRMVSADPSKRAKRGGRGGESDFGAGDRGSGNKAARRAGTYQEEEFAIDEADSIAKMRERAAKRRQQRYGKQGGGGRDDFRPYTKADYERGAANDPRKKVKEDFEFWVNELVEEGYDLSDYTWDEMYEFYLDEGLSGERYKRALKKGKMYTRMVSADPSKRATRGGRGGESDFGAGDRGSGNKAARRAGTYREYDVNEASSRDEFTRAAIARSSGRKGGITFEPGPNWDPSANRGKGAHISPKQKEKQRRKALRQEEFEAWLDEAMTNYEKNRKRAAQRAAARNAARDQGKTGAVPGVGYVTPRRERETWTDESGKTRHAKGL